MRKFLLFQMFAFTLVAGAATNDLDVARQALRDGFWSLARTRAQAQAPVREEARQIVLESWAREGKWAEIPKALESWGNPAGDVYMYYRALAKVRTTPDIATADVFGMTELSDPVFARLASRLKAEVALGRGENEAVVKILGSLAALDSEDRILLAEARSRLGEEKAAATLWRAVLADTNASVHASVTAAANLGDEARLRLAVSNAVPADVRSLARLRLGSVLLAKPGGFDEGAELIRAAVAESPDAEGAFEASRLLAAARLRREDWAGAAKAYAEILEIWPSAARLESVQEGLGWALLKQGRSEEALQTFHLAESCATTDEDRATAAAKVADALAALGRLDESTAKCREVVAKWPQTLIAKRLKQVVRLRELEAKGRDLYGKFRFAEAQAVFHEVGAGDEMRRGRMAFFEALCLYGQGRDEESESRARALVEATHDPKLRADVTLWLARAAYNAGRWREARELFVRSAASPLSGAEASANARIWAARAALAANDFSAAIALAAEVVGATAPVVAQAEALIVQGEALLELARFDEAVLVFERAAAISEAPANIRLEAQVLRADALYAMGADNPARYEEALAAYRAISQKENIPEESCLALAYKIGVTLEKLKRKSEAVDQYYAHVLLAYRDARREGRRIDDEGRAVFARAAFRLADLCEGSGQFRQAESALELVAESDVPAAAEARNRIERLRMKGILP